MDGRNYLDWMVDFETHLGIKHVSSTLTAIGVARHMLLGHLLSVAERDMDVRWASLMSTKPLKTSTAYI